MKNTLLIDGQLFQTGTWHRGMGKYALEMINALSSRGFFKQFESVEIILNDSLELEAERQTLLKNIYEEFNFTYLKLSNRHDIDSVRGCEKKNKKILNDYIAKNHGSKKVDFMILSLFEGDLAVPVFPNVSGIKAMLFFDIIPYLFSGQYLNDDRPTENYLDRYGTVFETDAFFTISQTTRNDLITYFGIPEHKVINIDGAPIQLQRSHVSPQKPSINEVDQNYILLPSGNDIRKNNDRAVHAFDMFNKANGQQYKLLITSTFTEDVQHQLTELSNDIVFTGNVNEQEMKWLYENAEAILFPPLYEGLGLPILEAVESGKSIACSRISVFQEMSEAFNYFDPYDINSMAAALESAVNTSIDKTEYTKIAAKYTWENTAEHFGKGWEEIARKDSSVVEKKKIAIIGPTPAGYSGIGKFMQLLHPTLSQYFDITYYLENNDSGNEKISYLDKIAEVHDILDFTFPDYKKYEAVVYHIGNSDYHNVTHWLACRYPGYAIFHDTHLNGLMGTLQAAGLMSAKRFELEEELNKQANTERASYVGSVANNQLGIICHSNYALNAIKSHLQSKDILAKKLNLPVSPPVDHYEKASSQITVGVAGILHSTKGLSIVEMLAGSDNFSEINFKLFGYGFGATEEELQGLRALPNVEIITDVSDFEFNRMLNRVDVLLNFRPKYNGESSYVTLEAMRHGTAVVVRDIGFFAELPEGSVVKVKNEIDIEDELLTLIKNQDKRHELYRNARAGIKDKYSFEKYAKNLKKIMSHKSESGELSAIKRLLLDSPQASSASDNISEHIRSA